MVAMAEVVRITDRFCDRKNPDSIDRQGKLGQVAVLVLIFYAIMGIAFVKMQELEKKKPHIIHDVDVSFEFTAPPPEPTFKVGEMPKPISLTEGENANPGSAAASKAAADTVSLPTVQAPEVTKTSQVNAKPVASHTVTEAAPVAVTSTNQIKAAAPVQEVKKAPSDSVNPTVAGAENHNQTSGAAQAGGTPDGQAGGTGTGGEGTGGTGTGQGDPGAGSGFGIAGGQIATKLENTGRAMGNIAPYRKGMLIRIAQNWHPKRKSESIVVLITLDHDGKLLSDEILQSSGNRRSDKEALAAIESTEFEGLPDWYKGEQLQFKINLDKVEALQQQ